MNGYTLAYRMRRRMQRHPWVAFVVAIALSGLLSAVGGGAVLLRWTTLDRQWETWLGDAFVEPPNPEKLSRVHVIGITDDTDIDALARKQVLPDVTSDNVRSWRRLHGRLMERLAGSGGRAVIWDISFPTDSPFDETFVEGVRALKNKGIPTVVGVEAYWSGDRRLEMLTQALVTEVKWGALSAGFTADDPSWWIPFAAFRVDRQTLPSLVLQALASVRRPGYPNWFQLDDTELLVQIGRQTTAIGESAAGWTTVDRVRLAARVPITELDPPPPQFGLGVGDVMGVMDVPMPTDRVLRASTIEYSNVFGQTEKELQAIFNEKVIVIGYLQSDREQFDHPDRRRLHGVHGQAVAMDTALRTVIARLPSHREFGLTAALGAILGGFVALAASRRGSLGLFGGALLVGAILITTILLRKTTQFVFDPLVPGCAVLMATALGAIVGRVSGWRWHLKR